MQIQIQEFAHAFFLEVCPVFFMMEKAIQPEKVTSDSLSLFLITNIFNTKMPFANSILVPKQKNV